MIGSIAGHFSLVFSLVSSLVLIPLVEFSK